MKYSYTPSYTLKKGASGGDVRVLQEELNTFGCGLTVDGDFGDKSDEAVRKF